MLDIHCHIIPQVDDGAQSEAESLQMLKAAKEAGIDRLVATPHLKSAGLDFEAVCRRFAWMKQQAAAEGILAVLGFEVNTRVLPDFDTKRLRRFCMGESSLLLLEFQEDDLTPGFRQMLYQLEREDLRVVIAHPERYGSIQKDPGKADMLLEMGCRLQIDAGSLLRPIWSEERRTAVRLLRQGKVSFLASDAHSPEDYQIYKRVLGSRKWTEQVVPSGWEEQLVF